MALTATASERVQRDIVQQLRMRDPLMLRASFNRPNIAFEGEGDRRLGGRGWSSGRSWLCLTLSMTQRAAAPQLFTGSRLTRQLPQAVTEP